MRILLLSNYYPEHHGGIENVAHNLVRSYRANGHVVHWMAGDVARWRHKSAEGDLPFKVINLAEDRLGFPYPIPYPLSMIDLIKQVKWSDAIHLHDCLYVANVIAFVVSRFIKKPVLVTQHIGPIPYPQPYKNWLQILAYRTVGAYVLSRAEKVVFLNRVLQGYFSKFVSFQPSPIVIPNGIDKALFFPATFEERQAIRQRLGLPRDRKVMLFVGRFVAKKGIHLVRSAIEADSSQFWVLIGRDGDETPGVWPYQNLKVVPVQPQDILRDYYAAADLLVLPSYGEGFPCVVQEAMACGTPVIISEETACAIPELANLAFITRLTLDELERCIQIAVSDTERLHTMRGQVHDYAVKNWSWKDTVCQYEEHLRAILKR